MKNRNGFTLIELLVTFVILAVVILIAVPLVSDVIKTNNSNYYIGQEKLLLIAGKDYFIDYRSMLPKTTGTTVSVTSNKLIDYKYIEKLNDVSDNACTNSKVLVELKTDGTYEYTACLICTNYTTSNAKCN